jgi:hypothetical protein
MDLLLCAPPKHKLGWIDAVVSTAGSITNSMINQKTQAQTNEAQIKAIMLQSESQQILAQQQAVQTDKIIKAVMIGGGVLAAGALIYFLAKKKKS